MSVIYKVNKNFVLQKIDKGLIGFDVDRSYLYTFNETAEYIFKKIKSGWTEEKIANALAQEYSAPLSILKKDVSSLIKNMVKRRILLSV